MGRVYAIISGKGGVGKTTSAVNIGFSINEAGEEVIIVDANLTTPNVGLHLGSPIVPITINDVMKGEAKPEEAIYEHETGTKIMPSSLSITELKDANHEKIIDLTKKLRKLSNHIILDSPAGLGEDARATIKSADDIVIITNPEISAVTDALKTIKLAEQLKKKVLGVIITRHTGEKWEMPIDSIKDMLEVPLLGVVPEENAIKESHVMKNPVILTHPKSKSARAYRNLTLKILGKEPIRKEKQDRNEKGFFSKVWSKITGKE
jgi:septum site-determining protein MinD